MRLVASTTVAVAVLVSLTACAGTDSSEVPATTSALGPVAVTTAPERDDVAGLQQLAAALTSLGAPGVLVHTETTGRGTVDVAVGMADLTSKAPLDPASHFRIGSVTKMFVATVVLQLAAEGGLRLDESVDQVAPGLLADDRITVRMLLNHTSGLGDFPPGFDLTAVLADPRRVIDSRQVLELVKRGPPPSSAPGTKQAYSNVGYLALGVVVETVSGVSVSDAIRTRILEPLHLTGTSWPSTSLLPEPHPHGYVTTRPTERDQVDYTELDPSFGGAAGALVSTTGDLAAFVRAIAQDRLLRPEDRALMWAPFDPKSDFRYGLGVESFGGSCFVPYFGHYGALPGFGTFVATTWDGRRQVVLMTTNSLVDVPDPQRAVDKLVERLLCPTGS